MTTAARPRNSDSAHWYDPLTGDPCYEVTGKTTGRPRPTNITDARARGLVPSVTTILKVLHKEALVNWIVEQAVLACLTTPRKMIKEIDAATGQEIEKTEELDAFIKRVLHIEKVQDEESQLARDKGTQIHDALEHLFSGAATPIDADLQPWIMPAYEALKALGGEVLSTEQILVGDGYAGRTDLILSLPNNMFDIWDFKSAKTLPDVKKGGAWAEHRLQLSAYSQAFLETELAVNLKLKPENIRTRNLYISTVKAGEFVICEHENWSETYWSGFVPLVQYWQWANKFKIATRRAAPVVELVAEAPVMLGLGEPEAQAIADGAAALAKAEPPAPPRKRKVALDIGVRTLVTPSFAPMVPPLIPPND